MQLPWDERDSTIGVKGPLNYCRHGSRCASSLSCPRVCVKSSPLDLFREKMSARNLKDKMLAVMLV